MYECVVCSGRTCGGSLRRLPALPLAATWWRGGTRSCLFFIPQCSLTHYNAFCESNNYHIQFKRNSAKLCKGKRGERIHCFDAKSCYLPGVGPLLIPHIDQVLIKVPRNWLGSNDFFPMGLSYSETKADEFPHLSEIIISKELSHEKDDILGHTSIGWRSCLC